MRRLLLLCGAIAGLGAGGLYLAALKFSAPGPAADRKTILVPHGGVAAVAAALRDGGEIDSVSYFQAAAALTAPEGLIHAGELEFPAHASVRDVLNVLRSGHPVRHRVTLAEGLTAAQISQMLARTSDLRGDLAVLPEGTVLPDTYEFQRGSDAASVQAQGEAAMKRALAAEWARRAPDLPLHSAREALILASIVEHEARLPTERPMIARVFLNRLSLGMRLQADPTAAYSAQGGLGRMDRALDHADLEVPGPYNTYVISGLPEGPICSPGLATIRAVLHPASGNALYFVADGTGGHLFTDRLAAHEANVAHLRSVRP
jgi:UPF0755 protein